MPYTLIIVARDRPTLFQHLSERQSPEVQVLLDRRQTPRPTNRASALWQTNLERDGYIVVPMT